MATHQKNDLSKPQSHGGMTNARLFDVLRLSSTIAAGTNNPFFPLLAPKRSGGSNTSSCHTKLALPPPPVCTTASIPPLQVSDSKASDEQTNGATTNTVHYYHHHFPMALTSAKLAKLPIMLQADVSALSMEDIAKEAMRIAKESIRKQEEERKASAAMAETASANNPISQPQQFLASSSVTTNMLLAAQHPTPAPSSPTNTPNLRLNKFVRRLHDMLKSEKDKGVVEWRRGLLVLHSTATFAKHILPKFFNTRNFKTFRRQLNYYGFVHVRSFSNTAAATTTALWVHQDLAASLHGITKHDETPTSGAAATAHQDPDDLSHLLKLRRVEPNEDHKTVEGRRQRKEMALYTVEEDLQVSTKSLQQQQIQSLLTMSSNAGASFGQSGVHQEAKAGPDDFPYTSVILESTQIPTSPDVRSESSSLNKNGVPLVMAVPSPSSQGEKRALSSQTDEKSLPFKKKMARLAATSMSSVGQQHSPRKPLATETGEQPKRTASCRTLSVSSSSLTGNVSSDDENTPVPKPIKTESSAANLLLLLSRAAQEAA